MLNEKKNIYINACRGKFFFLNINKKELDLTIRSGSKVGGRISRFFFLYYYFFFRENNNQSINKKVMAI